MNYSLLAHTLTVASYFLIIELDAVEPSLEIQHLYKSVKELLLSRQCVRGYRKRKEKKRTWSFRKPQSSGGDNYSTLQTQRTSP